MINVSGIVHIADNGNPGIWYEFGYGWAKAVPALPFDAVNVVKARIHYSGIEPDKETHKAIIASITGNAKGNRAIVQKFIAKVREGLTDQTL